MEYIIYYRYIGDGNCKTYKCIAESRLYRDDITVNKKVMCWLHPEADGFLTAEYDEKGYKRISRARKIKEKVY